MSKVQGIQSPAISPTNHGQPARRADRPPPQSGQLSDVMEISRAADLASKVFDLPEVRTELIEQVKKEIAEGMYETPEKLRIAAERILQDLLPNQ